MNRTKSRQLNPGILFCTFLAILLMSFPVIAQEQQPLEPDRAGNMDGTKTGATGIMSATIELFKAHISPIDGDRCPMYPSCSEYSRESFGRHGFFMGWIMTCDRLVRCGRNERTTAPRIVVGGVPRYYDSVEDNDFWWSR